MQKSCIPNIFTFINLGCGILSLLQTHEGNYMAASIFILVAGLVDRYDGRVARFLDVSSELGKELDSLADLVSFGVAPALLLFVSCGLKESGPYGIFGIIVLILLPICGAFRLARYNISTFDGVFTGVPITIVGCFLAVFKIVTIYVEAPVFLVLILMILGSYLEVSTLHLKKV